MKYISLILLTLIVSTPFAASASTPKPTCEFNVTTPTGTARTTKSGKVFIQSGQKLELAWDSENATKAVNNNGKDIKLASSTIIFPTKDTSFTYTFSAGSKKAICSLSAVIASASLDTDSISNASTRPTITGTAEGTKTVHIEISNDDGSVFKSRELRVKGGKWSVKLSKTLEKGTYQIVVYGDKKYDLNELASGTLGIGTAGGTSSGTGAFSASPIPLLTGGTTGPNTTVPVSYLKLVNQSSTATTLPGLWIKQSGTAPTSSVISFSTVDDKAVSRTSVGGAEGSALFKNGLAYVPLNATFVPGQFRIFTIKAQLSRSLIPGSTLMLDVASLDTKGKVAGSFPIRGTTWVLKAY